MNKYHIEDLKTILHPSTIAKDVIKAFCVILNIKPKWKGKAVGNVEVDYCQSFRSLIVNNRLIGMIKNSNKYALSIENIQKADRILKKYRCADP